MQLMHLLSGLDTVSSKQFFSNKSFRLFSDPVPELSSPSPSSTSTTERPCSHARRCPTKRTNRDNKLMNVLQNRRDATRKGKQSNTAASVATVDDINANSSSTKTNGNETTVVNNNLVVKMLRNKSVDLRTAAAADAGQGALNSGEESLQMQETIFSLHQVDPKKATTKFKGGKDYTRYYLNTNRTTVSSTVPNNIGNTSNDIEVTTLKARTTPAKRSRGRVRFVPDRSSYDSELIQFAIFRGQSTSPREAENMLSKLSSSRRRTLSRTRPSERIELLEFSSTPSKPSTEKNRVWQQNQINHLNKNLVLHNMRRPYTSFIPTSVLIRPTTIKSIEVTYTDKPWKAAAGLVEDFGEAKNVLVRSALKMEPTPSASTTISSIVPAPEEFRRQLVAASPSTNETQKEVSTQKPLPKIPPEVSTIVNVIEVTTMMPLVEEPARKIEVVIPSSQLDDLMPRKEKRVDDTVPVTQKIEPESVIKVEDELPEALSSINSASINQVPELVPQYSSTSTTTTTMRHDSYSTVTRTAKVTMKPMIVASKDAQPIPSSSLYSNKSTPRPDRAPKDIIVAEESQNARSVEQTIPIIQRLPPTSTTLSTFRPSSYYYTRTTAAPTKSTRVYWTTSRSSSWRPSSTTTPKPTESTISTTATPSTAPTSFRASFSPSTVPPILLGKLPDSTTAATEPPNLILTRPDGEEKSQLESNDTASTNFTLFALIALGVAPVVALLSYIVRTIMRQQDKDEGFIDGQPISPVVRLEQSDATGSEFSIPDSKYGRSNLKFKSLLGEGNFGQVWKAEIEDHSSPTGMTVVAVKTEKKGKGQGGLEAEAEIMRKLGSHTNIIMLLEAYTEHGEFRHLFFLVEKERL